MHWDRDEEATEAPGADFTEEDLHPDLETTGEVPNMIVGSFVHEGCTNEREFSVGTLAAADDEDRADDGTTVREYCVVCDEYVTWTHESVAEGD